jgi:hypothetical protein
MGAAAHEQEAQQEERAAAWHTKMYQPNLGPPCIPTIGPAAAKGNQCLGNIGNITSEHLRAAEEHRRHAAEHRAASKLLRDTEARACAGVAEEDRDVSPFFHGEDIVRVDALRAETPKGPVPLGARIVFRPIPGMTVAWLQRIVDCHLARNSVLGLDTIDMDYCPLAMRNVTAHVIRVWDGLAVDVQSSDSAAAVRILARANALTVAP